MVWKPPDGIDVPDWSFAKGRDFAAWVGLTPRQHSSGGKTRMGATRKIGERSLRR